MSARPLVVVAEPVDDAALALLREGGCEVDLRAGQPPAEWADVLERASGLVVRSGTTVDAAMLEAAPALRVVGRAGVGLDNVDVGEATRRGIAVVNTPGGNATAAAEHTLALMLALARHVAPAHQSLVEGRWDRHRYVGRELAGKELGLVGAGRVGALVAERARAFGMRVSVLDPFLSEERAKAMGVTRVDNVDELLLRADVLSLHAPLTDETRRLLDDQRLARLKRGALLVNCARGGLVDEAAVARALRDGQLGGAALDVFDHEPPEDSPLLGAPNLLHTPHLGASTVEAKAAVGRALAEGLVALLRDGDYSAAVNLAFAGPGLRDHLPLLDLARRLGRLQAGLLGGAPSRVVVELSGEGGPEPAPLAQAFLSGLLQVVCGGEINPINAGAKADELGLDWSVGHRGGGRGPRLHTRVEQGDRSHDVDGGLVGPDQPRVLAVDGRGIDLAPHGDLLILTNEDRPGVVGAVGQRLGEAGINIGEMRLGRREGDKVALSVWQVDQALPAGLLAALRELPAVTSARQAQLGPPRGVARGQA